jgi:hypothetical protein
MAVLLSACGSGNGGITVVGSQAGASPFISFVQLGGKDITGLASVEFRIAPKPGSVSKAVDVRYSMATLADRGYVAPDSVRLPVFGPNADYANQVSLRLQFQDGSAQTLAANIATAAYMGHLLVSVRSIVVIPPFSKGAMPVAHWASISSS